MRVLLDSFSKQERALFLDEHKKNRAMVSFFAGGLGIDRFILEDIGIGIGKLLTCGCCGLWWLVDLIYIMDATRDKNYQTMLTAIAQLQ